jgi:endonuclease YncB( thermonuclease family)
MVRMRDVWQRQTRGHGIGGVVWLLLILLPALGHAEQFTGKVVGISDGDTLNVLREGKAVKVRLYGIDTPERAQAFGTRAQQFTSELAFGNEVTVVVRDTDRFGRVVGEVRLPEPDGRNLNQELVKAGMAWWYKHYAPNDTTLAQLEADARAAQRGLWAEAHPVPPWAWRRGERAPAQAEGPAASATPGTPDPVGPVIGNRRSKVYHWAGCPDYDKVAAQNRVAFPSRADAEQAGYRPARNCP